MKSLPPRVAVLLLALVASCQTVRVARAELPVFSPEKNPDAERITHGKFQIVEDLRGIDPGVLKAFHAQVPTRWIANKGEAFEAGDAIGPGDARPARRLVLAGGSPELWFILYEQGGFAHYLVLAVFKPERDGVWRLAVTANGPFPGEHDDFNTLKTALQQGRFIEQPTPPDP